MKKIIAIALAALLALTLASCGGRKPANDGGSAAEADTTAALAETTAGEAAPSDETLPEGTALSLDGSRLGVLQTVAGQDGLRVNGLLFASGSGHHTYPSIDEMIAGGYRTEGLCDEFFLSEWIEVYGDVTGSPLQVYVLPNDPGADYTKLKTADLAAMSQALDYPIFADEVVPDAENHGFLCSFYVHQELPAGLYNVFFAGAEEICGVVQLNIVPLEE